MKQSESLSTYDARELETRRRVWWEVLELDAQVTTLVGGQEAYIEADYERPWLEDLTTYHKELESAKVDFRLYTLDVLHKLSQLDSETEVGGHQVLLQYTDISRLERLQRRLPQLSRTAGRPNSFKVAVADLQVEFYAFKLFLYCVLARSEQYLRQNVTREEQSKKDNAGWKRSADSQPSSSQALQSSEVYIHQNMILDSTRHIINTYVFIDSMEAQDRTINWSRCFNLYCAVCVLAIACLRSETQLESDIQLVTHGRNTFQQLNIEYPECKFAGTAIHRISDLLSEVSSLWETEKEGSIDVSKAKEVQIETELSHSYARRKKPGAKSSSSSPRKKRQSRVFEENSGPAAKRQRTKLGPAMQSGSVSSELQNVLQLQNHDAQQSLSRPSTVDAYNPPSAGAKSHNPHSSQRATGQGSFTGNNSCSQKWLSELGGYDTSMSYGLTWFHPPMIEPMPPMQPPGHWMDYALYQRDLDYPQRGHTQDAAYEVDTVMLGQHVGGYHEQMFQDPAGISGSTFTNHWPCHQLASPLAKSRRCWPSNDGGDTGWTSTQSRSRNAT